MLVDIDLVMNTWDIFQNGSLLYNGFFDTSGGDIESIRFSYGTTSSTGFDSVGLDDDDSYASDDGYFSVSISRIRIKR